MINRIAVYEGTGSDPYENLALELYLTESAGEGECILYLWQNADTVVIGRNQNAWQECNRAALERDGVTLARRLSGGGAVFHDLGNLCFTFCARDEVYDLPRQQRVLIEACRILGIKAELSGRNDLLADGRKFSGNSFYSHGGRSFHNGTFLINADMQRLGRYLIPSAAKLKAKGVASVRSRVINLTELVPELSVDDVKAAMVQAFGNIYGLEPKMLGAADLDGSRVGELRKNFASYEWNYGKSIQFDFSCGERFDWGEITIDLAVKDGRVSEAAVYSDALDESFAAPLAKALTGARFTGDALCEAVRGTPESGAVAEDICRMLEAQEI